MKRKIVQVISLDGQGSYVASRISALFDDGTIWEGRAETAFDDVRLRKFSWEQVIIPNLPEKAGF